MHCEEKNSPDPKRGISYLKASLNPPFCPYETKTFALHITNNTACPLFSFFTKEKNASDIISPAITYINGQPEPIKVKPIRNKLLFYKLNILPNESMLIFYRKKEPRRKP